MMATGSDHVKSLRISEAATGSWRPRLWGRSGGWCPEVTMRRATAELTDTLTREPEATDHLPAPLATYAPVLNGESATTAAMF